MPEQSRGRGVVVDQNDLRGPFRDGILRRIQKGVVLLLEIISDKDQGRNDLIIVTSNQKADFFRVVYLKS